MFWLEKGDKILLIIVAVCSLLSLAINKLTIVKSNWRNSPWLKWLLLLICFGVISDIIHGFGSRELRALETCALLLLCIDTKKINLKVIALILLIGAANSFSVAYYYQYIEYTDRRIWPVNAIPFASYITLLTGLSFAFIKYSRSKLCSLILLSSTTIGFAALLLTESRGPLLALICTAGVLCLYAIFNKQVNWKISAGLLCLIALVAVATAPVIQERFDRTVNEVNNIIKGNDNTSIGYRLTVYRIGVDMIAEKPIFGHGKADLSQRWDEMLKNKEINRSVHRVLGWNFHNNFIEKGVASGLVGIATMFLWLGLPIVYAWRHHKKHLVLVATAPLLYFFACLTDTPATNGSSYVTYLIFVGLVLANIERCKINKHSTPPEESTFA